MMTDHVGVMTFAKEIKPGMEVMIEQFATDPKTVERVERYNDGLVCLIFTDEFGVYLDQDQTIVRLEHV
jgi:hypothetical protein